VSPADLRVEADADGVVAYDGRGVLRWRHRFPVAYSTTLAQMPHPARLVAGDPPEIYVATAHTLRRQDEHVQGGTLTALDLRGRVRRSFAFDDTPTFGRATYGPPWAITMFAVDPNAGSRRVAVAAHHYTWSAGLVTILDEQWQRRGTFVHHGWIEGLHWIARDRMLVGGFSNGRDGGMVALLDPAALHGQGPEPPDSEGYCATCGSASPVRMVVMPRTELNRATVSRFNRAVLQIAGDRILARTIEVPLPGNDVIDAVYEFTPSLDILRHPSAIATGTCTDRSRHRDA